MNDIEPSQDQVEAAKKLWEALSTHRDERGDVMLISSVFAAREAQKDERIRELEARVLDVQAAMTANWNAWQKESFAREKAEATITQMKRDIEHPDGTMEHNSELVDQKHEAMSANAALKERVRELEAKIVDAESCPCSGGGHSLTKCPWFRAEKAEAQVESWTPAITTAKRIAKLFAEFSEGKWWETMGDELNLLCDQVLPPDAPSEKP